MNETATTTTQAAPVVLKREGSMKGYIWCQFMIVTDGRVVIVDMKPAPLGGWHFDRVTVQGASDWPNMTQAQILAWKFNNDDGRTHVANEITSDFRTKLLAKAA